MRRFISYQWLQRTLFHSRKSFFLLWASSIPSGNSTPRYDFDRSPKTRLLYQTPKKWVKSWAEMGFPSGVESDGLLWPTAIYHWYCIKQGGQKWSVRHTVFSNQSRQSSTILLDCSVCSFERTMYFGPTIFGFRSPSRIRTVLFDTAPIITNCRSSEDRPVQADGQSISAYDRIYSFFRSISTWVRKKSKTFLGFVV